MMTTTRLPGGALDRPALAGPAAPRELCAKFHKTIELVGKRWTGAIVEFLMTGPQRFTVLRNAAPGLHDRLLSQRLKELEVEGLVTRRVYPETPVHIEYALTERGRDLEKVFGELHRWAERWIGVQADGAGPGRSGSTESARTVSRRHGVLSVRRRGSARAGQTHR
jgi:DNA-binding HxlR family transcriptional regulator